MVTVPLTPVHAAQFADSAYQMLTSKPGSIILPQPPAPMRANGGANIDFEIKTGQRFVGTSGIGPVSGSSGFGYVAKGTRSRQGQALIAIRGTDLKKDWLTDARMSGSVGVTGYVVHEGFNLTANSILPQIRAELGTDRYSAIHVVGHSLGGAVAALVADALATGKRADEVKLYTFGAPRAGTVPHTLHLTQVLGSANIYRVYHDTDPVPMVPIFPFMHAPMDDDGYMMLGGGTIISFGAHSMTNSYLPTVSKYNSWSTMKLARMKHRRFSLETVDELLAEASAGGYGPPFMSTYLLRLITRALSLILDGMVAVVGARLFADATVLDYLASVIASGAAASLAAAERARALLESIMSFLGKTLTAGTNLSVAVIRYVLDMLFSYISSLAHRAISLIG